MSSATHRCAVLPLAPLRPRPLWRARCAAAAVSHRPAVVTRFTQQLRKFKQLGAYGAAATASSPAAQSAARGGRQAAPARQPAGTVGGARPGAGGARRPGIVWFRGDLRLHDHEALTRAQAECSSLVPVYCFDPRDYGKSPQGYDKTGPCRAAFLREAVADLRAALRAAGSELIVRVGRAEEVVGELVRRTGAAAVYCHTEVTFEELRVEAAVKAAAEAGGAALKTFWAGTLCHLADLPFKLEKLPQNFDKFRELTSGAPVRAALAAPRELRGLPLGARVDPGEVPTLQQLGLQPLPASKEGAGARSCGETEGQRGGEGEALRQLQGFLAAAQAGGTRAGAAYGSSFSARVAPWLAAGCLSPRRMLEDAQRVMGASGGQQGAQVAATSAAGPVATASSAGQPLAWVQFELLWRDFFRFMTMRYSTKTLPSTAKQRALVAA